jgi:hypothetical protein
MTNIKTWLSVCLISLAAVVSTAAAQMDAGSLRVLILDRSEAVVPGAAVTLTNSGTGTSQAATADDQGYVNFTPLPRGTYELRTELQGFRAAVVKDVTVDVNERRFLRVTLDTAAVAESVEVTAQRQALQTEEGSIGQVIQGKVAVELPLAGRRYTELALLIPGSSPSTMTITTRGPGWFVSNGNYHTQNNFMLDGFDNNQGTQNAQSLSAQVVQPNPDAIEQFKVQTNSFSAEFGRSAGAVVNVSIKSGTNNLNGSAFYYNRDASLAAKSWNANTNGLPKDTLGWHQGGGTVGGPLRQNKLFFFGAWEGFHQDFSTIGTATVPTMAQRQGVFPSTINDPLTGLPFANNTIPSNRFDPLATKVMGLYPEPNRPGDTVAGGRVTNNYAYDRPGTENTHKVDTRIDAYADNNNRVFVRYSLLRQLFDRERLFPSLGEGTSDQGQQYNRNHSVGGSWNRIIGSRIVNEARVGYNNTVSSFTHAAANDQKADEFGFVGLPQEFLQTGGIPLMDLANYQDLGIRNFRPQYQKPNAWQFLDTLSMAYGRHSLRTGFEARTKQDLLRDIERVSPRYQFTGGFTTNDFADFLLGYANLVQATTQPEIDWRQQAYSAFVQDDWKVRPDLTLNLGLRYEYTTPYYGAGANKNINFDFATGQLVTATDSNKYLMNTDRNNLAPRLGLAWQAVPDRVVVRGGFGVFYSLEDMRGSEGIIALNPPTLINAALQRVGNGPPPVLLSAPFPAGLTSNFVSTNVSVKAREVDQQAAQVTQWNVATEFSLPWQSTLEVAYVGNRGTNLLTNVPVNGVPFGVDGTVPANRPYPNWAGIDNNVTEGQSIYHALQLKYEKRYAQGVYLLGSYTYSDAQDEIGAWGAGGSGAQIVLKPDYSNLDEVMRGERGPNGQIAKNRFTLTQIWQLPIGRGHALGNGMSPALDAVIGGWQFSSIWTVRTGLPVNVTLNTTGTNPITGQAYRFLGRNGGYVRPNLAGDPNGSSDATANRLAYLDPAAYNLQALDTPGNAPRNSAYGPGLFTTDVSLVKRFTFSALSADLRLEAFNVFNHVNYDQPAATWGSANFGQITNAFSPRVVQLAVRASF